LVEKWWGKPKGMKQLLLERRKIDLMKMADFIKWECYSRYKLSLKKLLEDCEDFKNETSIKEFISEQRGTRRCV
jgi:hypothetical protein